MSDLEEEVDDDPVDEDEPAEESVSSEMSDEMDALNGHPGHNHHILD